MASLNILGGGRGVVPTLDKAGGLWHPSARMSELPKAYEPQAVEAKWYAAWIDGKCFEADPSSAKEAYSIVIPPPNVTGMLHLGHVLNNTLQDILIRRARQEGKEALWLPGTDHAGIATQTGSSANCARQKQDTAATSAATKFLERVWDWQGQDKGDIIIEQLSRLGCSCDWSRERVHDGPGLLAVRCCTCSWSCSSRATSTAASAWSTGARSRSPPCPTRR